NNVFYGMMGGGGANNKGLLFEYAFAGSSFTNRFDFTVFGQGAPIGLTKAGNNKIYWVTATQGQGLYEFDPVSFSCTRKYDFANIVEGSALTILAEVNGKLYGSGGGGKAYAGVIFEFNYTTGT